MPNGSASNAWQGRPARRATFTLLALEILELGVLPREPPGRVLARSSRRPAGGHARAGVVPDSSVVVMKAVSGANTMTNPRIRYDRRYRAFRVSFSTRTSVSVARLSDTYAMQRDSTTANVPWRLTCGRCGQFHGMGASAMPNAQTPATFRA